MKAYHRLFVFLLASLAITVLISPWIAVWWDRFASARPAWEPFRYSFSRIFDRCFLVTTIMLFLPCRRYLRIGSARELGLAPAVHVGRDISSGFAAAVISMALLVLLMCAEGIFTPYFRLSPGASVARLMKALLAGLSVSFLEEIFFRGIFFKGLLEKNSRVRAFAVSSLFFAAIHFVQPDKGFHLADYDARGGMHYLIASFRAFLDLPSLLPGFFGLFLIGLVLSYAVLRTDAIYLAIGLHAGWIFSLQSLRVFGDYSREDLGWFFGSTDPKIVSGAAAWLGIAAVAVAVHAMTRCRTAVSRGNGAEVVRKSRAGFAGRD